MKTANSLFFSRQFSRWLYSALRRRKPQRAFDSRWAFTVFYAAACNSAAPRTPLLSPCTGG
ncbi:hypothetical protein, partial [Serratia marcescens]